MQLSPRGIAIASAALSIAATQRAARNSTAWPNGGAVRAADAELRKARQAIAAQKAGKRRQRRPLLQA